MKRQLTKRDLLRWSRCPVAALHGLNGKTSKTESDPFVRYLSEEAANLKKLAKRLFVDVSETTATDREGAFIRTVEQVRAGKAVFGGTLTFHPWCARPSVLLLREDKLHLFRIDSKVGSLSEHRANRLLITYYGHIRSAWRESLESLAFDIMVAKQVFPSVEIVPWLLLPEATSRAGAAEVEVGRGAVCDSADNAEECACRRRESTLRFFKADAAMQILLPEIEEKAATLAAADGSGRFPDPVPRYACRNCEFRTGLDGDGFSQCWKNLPETHPSLFELHQLYALKSADGNGLLADEMISQGRVGLFDIPGARIAGEYAARQKIQWRHQFSGTEWLDQSLRTRLENLSWPLHFLDFETIAPLVPWFAGMRPNELQPFQWSMHTIAGAGELSHAEWLSCLDRDCVLDFARSLREALGADDGTVLVYTAYERQVLESVCTQLRQRYPGETGLVEWIADLLRGPRIVDQHQLLYENHFLPAMRGRTSLKVVLDAIWKASTFLRTHPWFSEYARIDETGSLMDPYKTLPAITLGSKELSVREGVGAMMAYREMIRGVGARDDRMRESLATALLQYCRLDTAAQVAIMVYWWERLGMVCPGLELAKLSDRLQLVSEANDRGLR